MSKLPTPRGPDDEVREILSIKNPLVRRFRYWQFERKQYKEVLSKVRFGTPMSEKEALLRIDTARRNIISIGNSFHEEMKGLMK